MKACPRAIRVPRPVSKPALQPEPASHGRAFTLIELLVVIGLIAFLAGGIGFALSDVGGNSLATAQSTLATLVGSARAQAAVYQTRARLAVYATRQSPDGAPKYLRLLQVFREEPAGSGTWRATGDAVYLPRGIYVVPASTAGLLAPGVAWPASPPLVSTLSQTFDPGQPAGTAFAAASGFYLEFAPDGTVTPPGTQSTAQLVVATAGAAGNLPQFNNPAAVRGLLVRPSGAVTRVNEAAGF